MRAARTLPAPAAPCPPLPRDSANGTGMGLPRFLFLKPDRLHLQHEASAKTWASCPRTRAPACGVGSRARTRARTKATGRAGSGRTDARAAPRPERPRKAGGQRWTTRLQQQERPPARPHRRPLCKAPPGSRAPGASPGHGPPGARPGSRCGEPRHPGEVHPCATAAASGFSPPASSSATRKASSSDWVALRRGSQAVW